MPNKKSEESAPVVQWITYLQADQSERLLDCMGEESERLRKEFGPEHVTMSKSKILAYVVNFFLRWKDAGSPDWDQQKKEVRELRKELREWKR